MKAFYLKNQKEFMNRLLRSDLFDHFLCAEATIDGAVSYQIDGHINRDFFDEDEAEALFADGSMYMPYSYLRPILLTMIRGTHTPLFLKLVLMLSPKNAANTIRCSGTSLTTDDINGIFFNLTYRNGQTILTTGVSYRTFTMDRSFDLSWDTFAARFLASHDLDFDIR